MCPPRLSRILLTGIVSTLTLAATPVKAQQIYSQDANGLWNAYSVDITARTWDAARVNANTQMFGGVAGNLAVMTSADEDFRVLGIAGGGRRDVWFGLTDSDVASTIDGFNAGTVVGASEGNFRWVTNEPFVYSNWNAGEPNNVGGEDAGQLGLNGKWNDNQAGSSLGQADTTFASVIEFRLQLTAAQVAQTNSLKVVVYKSGSTEVRNLAIADALIAGNDQVRKTTSYYTRSSMTDSGSEGDFGSDPGVVGAANEDQFVVLSTGYLVVKPGEAGDYVFRLNADDGQRLRIDTNRDGVLEDIIVDDVLSGPHNVDSGTVTLAPGSYALEWTWFEDGGGAEGELSASRGGGAFVPLGETGGLGLSQVPEPSVALLGGLGLLGLLSRRRRA
ncbi:MAG: C-type lectin domain protein [Chthoniobacteraceae bacterium]|nr:C-type lectin domain protein [Chthoniobacteraceae bacterium]